MMGEDKQSFKEKISSIRFRLVLSYLLILLVLISINVYFLVLHFRIVQEYKQITENLILENTLSEIMPEYVQAYFNVVNSPNSKVRIEAYTALREEIYDTLLKLDKIIVNEDSKIRYLGLKNTVKSLVSRCDQGIQAVSSGDLIYAISQYEYVYPRTEFIVENTAMLVIEELSYSEQLQLYMDRTNNLSIIMSIAIFIVATIGCLFYALTFSRKLTGPLSELTDLAKDIASQNKFDKTVRKELVERKDEIGILSRGFNSMIFEIRNKIDNLTNKEKETFRINRELEEANQKLLNLDKEKDEFISIAAHELKTPLTSIKGFAQLLNTKEVMKDTTKQKHYLSLVNDNTNRLYSLILDLVDSSRLSLGKLDIDVKEVDTKDIFKDIEENMTQVIKECGIKPAFTIEKNIPKVKADPERLLQVIRNLLVNATHFTKVGGTITFDARKKGNYVQFSVKDTGEGIPKNRQSQIFSRFYQADASLTRKVKGSGLGLSICKGLVELMKGKIW
ncbi:HAMP domain-containing histidine kinase, partial [Candidatus Woesearchaeota archaeon]|nr:HAMP domain-containing histidine kinase [Candidatus Woesearchaeota archaeon]